MRLLLIQKKILNVKRNIFMQLCCIFQILVDCDNAFGGYGSEVVRYLSDDYGSKSVAVFPCSPADVSGW